MAWESIEGGLSAWAPDTHVVTESEFLAPYLVLAHGQAFVAIWGREQADRRFLFLSAYFFQINK